MDDHWAILDLLRFMQSLHQCAHVMAVNVADVLETQFVDERTGKDSGRNRILHRLRSMMQSLAHRRN